MNKSPTPMVTSIRHRPLPLEGEGEALVKDFGMENIIREFFESNQHANSPSPSKGRGL